MVKFKMAILGYCLVNCRIIIYDNQIPSILFLVLCVVNKIFNITNFSFINHNIAIKILIRTRLTCYKMLILDNNNIDGMVSAVEPIFFYSQFNSLFNPYSIYLTI